MLVIVACKRDECEKMADLVDKCMPTLPMESVIEVDNLCRATTADQSVGGGYRACAKTTTCDELTACFEKHRCTFVLTGPGDTTPQLNCW